MNRGNIPLFSSGLGIAVESDLGDTDLIRKDLDILHRRSSALRQSSQSFEYSFLPSPASGERGCRCGLQAAIIDLGLCEIPLNKC